jgi:hypothetical protein
MTHFKAHSNIDSLYSPSSPSSATVSSQSPHNSRRHTSSAPISSPAVDFNENDQQTPPWSNMQDESPHRSPHGQSPAASMGINLDVNGFDPYQTPVQSHYRVQANSSHSFPFVAPASHANSASLPISPNDINSGDNVPDLSAFNPYYMHSESDFDGAIDPLMQDNLFCASDPVESTASDSGNRHDQGTCLTQEHHPVINGIICNESGNPIPQDCDSSLYFSATALFVGA